MASDTRDQEGEAVLELYAGIPDKISTLESQMEQVISMLNDLKPSSEEGSLTNTVNAAREVAAKEQESCPFDAEDIYETLKDPYPRSKKELVEFGKMALKEYKESDTTDLCDLFIDDFLFWEEAHFNMLPKSCVTSIRNLLLAAGCNVQKGTGFPRARALYNFIKQAKEGINTTRNSESNNKNLPWIVPKPDEVQCINEDAPVENAPSISSGPDVRERTYKSTPKPSYVGKVFPRGMQYTGSPSEPLRRRYQSFMDACKLCGVEPDHTETLFILMQNVFLKDAALIYYMDHVKLNAKDIAEAIDMLENQFLGHRAKRVNDEVWNELSFDFVRKTRESKQMTITNEETLNDLFVQITNLSDMRTGPGSDIIVIGKIISSVRDIPIFSVVCQNPPEKTQDLMAVLRSCALEADRAAIRAGSDSSALKAGNVSMAESLSFFVDRELYNKSGKGNFKGYGKGPRGRWKKWKRKKYVPPDVCIICDKKGCHSSKHGRQSKALLSQMATVLFTDDLGNESDTSTSDESGDEEDSDTPIAAGNLAIAYHVNAERSRNYMGIQRSKDVEGAVIDTGSSILSTIGKDLVNAAVAVSCIRTSVAYGSKPRKIEGIGPIVQTLGTFEFHFMFGSKVYGMKVYILPGASPLLLCHKDLDDFGLNYQTYTKKLTRVSDGYTEKVPMIGGLPWLVFTHPSYFSEAQLRSMHRNLGHPSVNKHMKLIEQAKVADLPDDTRKSLEELVKHCKACQMGRTKPRRFLFSIKDSITGEFNHVIEVDLMKLDGKYVLHVLCTGTLFQQGSFVKDTTAKAAWYALRKCWINIYAGAPDILIHDQGTHFTGADFKIPADELGIYLKGVPTEAHERIGSLERRHSVVRSVYNKLKLDLPKASQDDRLSLTFRAINDVPDSDTGICPTTMVFGVYPKLPKSGNRGSMAERARIISECTALATKLKSRRIIKDSIRKYHSPSSIEIEKVRRLVPGSDVLVYREKEGWKRYELSSVEGNDVKVKLPSGKISTFGIHNVRKLYDDESKTDAKALVGKAKSPEDYYSSRMSELNGLREMGTFQVVPKSESEGHRLYSSVFVDKIKSDGSKKSRLCVAAFNDDQHRLFTAAPTVKRMSLRLLISLSTMYGVGLHTRDVSKAFIQSTTTLRRPVYVRAPKELNVGSNILKINRPLYGMPESPIHWYNTYLSYHKDELGMRTTPMDNCLLYKTDGDKLSGIIGLQVDDTLIAGTKGFLETEDVKSKCFPNSGRSEIQEKAESFNGLSLSRTKYGYFISEKEYISKIDSIDFNLIGFEEFRRIKAQYAYAAYSAMPDILVHVSLLSQVTEKIFSTDRKEVLKLLKKLAQAASPTTGKCGMSFIRIDKEKADIFVCFDAAFGTNRDHTSQLGVLVLMRDRENGDCNIIHYSSSKSKRVCRSVLAAELFALMEGFDIGYTVRDSFVKCSGRKDVNLILATDSRSLFSLSITLAQTTEKRLLIDLSLIREAYEKRDINDIIWIAGNCNPADGLTKVSKRNSTLSELISKNNFMPHARSWIKRDNRSFDENITFSDKQKVPGVSNSI